MCSQVVQTINPEVSIIMPTYNRSDMITLAIESILMQNFNNWELLIIDNGSTDNTKGIVSSYVSTDKRIKYFYVEKSRNPGLADYFNYGINVAGGKYIARLDDDDEWYDPDKLNKQVNFLNENSEYNLVGGGAIMVDKNKNELYRFYKRETDSEIRKNALYACPFWHNTVLFRKNAAEKVGGYKNLRFGEDWELWLRLGKIGKFYNFKEYFSLYLTSGDRFSTNNQKFIAKTIIEIIKQYKNDYPNYRKALLLNYLQYLYSFVPIFIKIKTQNFLFYIKRNYF